MFYNVNLLRQNYSKFVQYIIFSVKFLVTEMTPKAIVNYIMSYKLRIVVQK